MGQRITVVTSGHLSTCPRMLKSADALAAAGYDVRVVAASTEPWAIDADRDVRSRRSWPATIVNYRKGDSGLTYWWTGARTRASRAIVERFGPERAPLPLVVRSVGRVHTEIVRAAAAQPADLIYGGTAGALAAVEPVVERKTRLNRIFRPVGFGFPQGAGEQREVENGGVHSLEDRVGVGQAVGLSQRVHRRDPGPNLPLTDFQQASRQPRARRP